MNRLRILGAVSLEREDGTSVRSVLAQPKRLALLAYLTLASPRGFRRRDTLLGIFWPELDERHARAALSQALYYLRRSLGPKVVIGRGQEEVAIDFDGLWCDATTLDEKLALGTVEAHAEAVDLFRGDLLPGFFVSDAPEFERWLERERQRLRGRVAEAAWNLCDAADEEGSLSRALEWGRRALALDETNEVGLRRLIVLLDRVGDRAGAIDLYEGVRQRLALEYEVEPAPETQRLIGSLIERMGTDRSVELATVSSPSPGNPLPVRSRDFSPDPSSESSPSTTRPAPFPGGSRRMGAGRVMSLLGGAALIGAILFRIPTAAPPDSGNLSAASGVDRNRVAVLPLQNLSPSADDAFIADGLTAELTTRLSRLRGLGVIPTISVSRPGRTERPPVEIGRELGVGTLIEGSVRKIESSVRMTVQLQDVATEEIVWAGSFDADVSQLLDMQRRVAEEVALQLKLSNISGNGLVDDPFGADSKAYESYLRARAALTRDDWTGVLEARDYFRQSVGHDSTFAGAWSGLAHATNELIRNGLLTGSGSWEAARRAAERALAHDAELPEAHAALAVVHAMADWSFVSAERHFQRALELDPSDVATRLDYAVLLRNDGRFDEALEQIHRARTLDPAMPQAALEEANLHYLAGRADHAVRLLEGLLGAFHGEGDRDGTGADRERFRIPPFWPHFTLALARAELGEYEAALESLDAGDPVGARPDTRAFRAYVLAEMGQPEAARKILDGASVDPGSAPMTEFHEAIVHVALGEHDRALDLLEAAARERSRLLRLLKVEPKLAPLRSHARYQALLVDLGLAGGGEVVAARSQGRGEDGVAPIPVAARGEARSPAGPH